MKKHLILLFAGVTFSLNAQTTPTVPFPNELNGLKFYRRYLSPLLPAHSDYKQSVEVLGPEGRLELKDWEISTLYSCSEDVVTCSHGPRNDPLFSITVRPKHRVNLAKVGFSSAFSRRYGTVSEINVLCSIYSDKLGMEYWLISKASGLYRVGDLLWIRYSSRS